MVYDVVFVNGEPVASYDSLDAVTGALRAAMTGNRGACSDMLVAPVVNGRAAGWKSAEVFLADHPPTDVAMLERLFNLPAFRRK